MTALSAVLLTVNAAYFLLFHSGAGKVLSALGAVIALVLLLLSISAGPYAERARQEIADSRITALAVLAFFAGPALWALAHGGRASSSAGAIVIAWMATTFWLIGAAMVRRQSEWARPSARFRLPLLTTLFVIWSGLFWLAMVWQTGARELVLTDFRQDRLSRTFEIWQTTRPARHLYLQWWGRDYLAERKAYTSLLHPYLLSFYGFAKLVRLVTGFPLEVGRNLTPFVMAVVGIATLGILLARSTLRPPEVGLRFYLTLFLGTGFLLSESHYWSYTYTQQLDNIFPLVAYLTAIGWAAAQPRITRHNRVALFVAAAMFGLFGWMYVPLFLLALWCFFGRLRPTIADTIAGNRILIHASAIAAIIGAITIALPPLLVAAKGYSDLSSSFAFRSGLDGDTRFFHDVGQAVVSPYCCTALRVPITLRSGSLWDLLFPAFVPLIFAIACGFWQTRRDRHRVAAALLFLVAPYFWSLALVPQAVSIHPFLYDHLLLLPAALLGTLLMLTRQVQGRLRGPVFLAYLLVMTTVIMANYVAIAQAMKKALAG